MFTITPKPSQYQTYLLRDQEAQSCLEVVPERGGIVSQWQIKERPILYLDAERFANPQLSIRGGIPILFPICGNLPNDTYSYQGQQYRLKQHGFARDLPWQVTAQGTEDLASITLTLNSNNQTRAVYPFDFQLTFTYKLRGNSLAIEQRYENHSEAEMPFSTGLHPYFWLEDKSQVTLDIPASAYQDQLTKTIHPFAGNFDFARDEIDMAFIGVDKNEAAIADGQRRLQIKLHYSDAYTTLVFWAVKGKDYVCLEPWSGPRNALNTGERLMYLPPHSSCETQVTISVRDFGLLP